MRISPPQSQHKFGNIQLWLSWGRGSSIRSLFSVTKITINVHCCHCLLATAIGCVCVACTLYRRVQLTYTLHVKAKIKYTEEDWEHACELPVLCGCSMLAQFMCIFCKQHRARRLVSLSDPLQESVSSSKTNSECVTYTFTCGCVWSSYSCYLWRNGCICFMVSSLVGLIIATAAQQSLTECGLALLE